MTCIVGLIHEKKVYIGADSAGSNSIGQQAIRADKKNFVVKTPTGAPFLFGCTSSFRMIQLLQFHLTLPYYSSTASDEDDDPLFRYMATAFIDAVRSCFKEGGYAKKDDEREEGGFFLVGCFGRLFCVQSDYQIEEVACSYNAVGSGGEIALGALHATQSLDIPPEQRIILALEASATHNAYVRGPYLLKTVEC